MNKLFYPALFHIAEEGGFWVSFPDLPGCLTQGESMEEAYEMAVDALSLCISDMKENNLPLPTPSKPDNINHEKDTFLVIVEFDIHEYQKHNNLRTINKTFISKIQTR